jgi:hypothetical protein
MMKQGPLLIVIFVLLATSVQTAPQSYDSVSLVLSSNVQSYNSVSLVLGGTSGGGTPPTSTCVTFATTGYMDCGENCDIATPIDMAGKDILIEGGGSASIRANVSNFGILTIRGISSTTRCIVTCSGGCFVK